MNTVTPNLADLPHPHQLSINALHTVTPNLADLPGDLSPVEASSGEEWQLKISIVKAHIGRSSGRSAWQIYPPIYPDEVFYAKDLLPVRVTI